jgi:hypothetical protein
MGMKVLKVEQSTQHIALIEKGDRLVHLTGAQVAVVIDEEGEMPGKVKIMVHMPEVDEDEEYVPFTVSLAAAVHEFLGDPDWVMAAQKRIEERAK